MWKVPLFDISFDEKEREAVLKVIDSGWLTMGEMTQNFEKAFAEFTGVKYAIAVSNGTTALHLANLVMGIGSNDEVICPSLTFVASSNAILYTGAKPVFADITSHDNFNISPEHIEAKITNKTRAIEVVHYAGYPCDMERITTIAGKYGLRIIEDCAHAPGAEYKGKKCGTLGDIGCFSFFSNKNMATAEGGMITTNNEELAEKVRIMRSHGMTTLTLDRHRGHAFSYNVVELGFNYRIDEIRAAIGIVQLEKLEAANSRRRELARVYRKMLTGTPGLKIPFENSCGISSHHIFPILLDKGINRQEFMEYLKEKGIQTSIHYPPIHQFDIYRQNLGYDKVLLSVTEEVAQREVTLPLYPSMGNEAVNYVCDTVIKYLQTSR
ncbi:MAG: DegT/DnrJ/EryC1/StrS family aminotransferase [Desulfobacterales bacterium]|nr:DegT/DnrJ/EryC1/StrS family aminotransferase [Desulfobacterales bacterium]